MLCSVIVLGFLPSKSFDRSTRAYVDRCYGEIIIYQMIALQCLNRYATAPYFPLIIQDDRNEIKETKIRPVSGYKLQLCLFAALTTERNQWVGIKQTLD